ncbi:sulfate ABC transporter substrate-binding protein [Aliishimia ponticola]|uniref:Sulfate ABC transporter substrate-binding protein n=1 Tax=Aliishimia ponticola TaxID=2499833 RepID=A0A4S4NA19_9RHOB|nr:substrate-binding domain-containing protein [Aliishimia ponticola]THH34841.1 sulfate ABC transporter substrate-binding protein [Aliishimia ponticola]
MLRKIMLAASLAVWGGMAQAADVMKMAVTTSFHNSGLADILLPEIEKDLDLEVQLLVVGTGQALKLGRAGDVDAVLVHSRAAEEAFVSEGYGTHRREIMYNDFVFIGPSADPAAIASAQTATGALQAIAEAQAAFVSRGDDSGTHKKELSLWREAGLDAGAFGDWYRAVGAGMGAALNTASGMDAYILADRASWLNFGNKGGLALLFSGDPVLFNQYAYLPVNPELHSHVKSDLVAKLEAWLTSPRAAELINSYTIGGETLFVFNAKPAG